MNTKPKPHDHEKDPQHGLATFEQLPEQTKELLDLKHQQEKATGHEETAVTKKIHHKAQNALDNTPGIKGGDHGTE